MGIGITALGHFQFHGDELIIIGLIDELQLGGFIGAGAAQFKADQAILISIIAFIIIQHIDVCALHLKNDAVATCDIAIKALTTLHIGLKALDRAVGFHGITLVAHFVIHGIEVFQLICQLLYIVIRGEIVECTLKDALFLHTAGFHQADHTITVNDHGTRISIHAHSLFPCAIYLRHGEGITILRLECLHICCSFIGMAVQSKNLQLIAVELICLLQIGELVFAGRAVGVPEVQHNGFLGLQDLGNGVAIAFCIRNGEVGNDITQLVDAIGCIAFLDHRSGQRDIGLGAGDCIGLLHVITHRNLAQFQGELLAGELGEGDQTILRQLAKVEHVLIAISDIVLDALQRQTAGGLHADLIDHISGSYSGGRRCRTGRNLTGRFHRCIAAGCQHHAHAQQAA